VPLHEEFESTGNWLFRWRSYLPLFLIGIFLLALSEYEYPRHTERLDAMWEALCLIVSFFGLAVRIFTIGHTPRRTSGRNTKEQVAKTLNTTGIYSLVRHPLYLGNFFIGLGTAFFPHLWWLTLIYILTFWLYYERIMFAEEAFLRNKFGGEYVKWAETTPAFIPRFKNYVKPSLPFSPRTVLKREYNGFFAIIVVLFILEVAGYLVGKHNFEVDLFWVVMLGAAFVIWIVLRTLKKRTNLLNVEGR
jgi:protein-S-isoprenylcysteine O-methyltransferase Ste14